MKNFNDLQQRLFKFSVDIIRFLTLLPNKKEYDVFRYQLSKSGTSIGANYEESQAAVSKKDFENKLSISLKEARETNYWLRLIRELQITKSLECERLLQESAEIANILATIIIKSKNK